MHDQDVIAYLYPTEGKGRNGAMRAMDLNKSRYCSPRHRRSSPQLVHSRSVRLSTEEPNEEADLEYDPCIKLTFSKPPKTRHGLVAGRNPNADIILPNFKGVSWHHFALTFDERKCLIVRDLGSTVGTRVIYDGEEGQRGHSVDWSARGPSLAQNKAPTIKIVGDLQFKLVVPNHDTTSQAYLDNVDRFLQGTVDTENLFSDLNLKSYEATELPTPGALTPLVQTRGQILWKKKIGQGTFAIVHYVWDVTSRAEYALKEPIPGKGGDWKREADIMKDISHDHIVALKYATFDAAPQLYFEYVPGGSLEAYPSTTVVQRRQILIQLLSGLTYLHGRRPPIAHRDIKPENVLVGHWSHEKVYVKLADFGLSKQSNDLKTFCGTILYAAPEIFLAKMVEEQVVKKYDPLVDNWSLSVLLVELEFHHLPKYSKVSEESGTAWAELLLEFVQKRLISDGANDLISFLLQNMLIIDPKKRQPTKTCYQMAQESFKDKTPAVGDGENSGPNIPEALSADQVGTEKKSPHEKAVPKAIEPATAAEVSTLHRKRRRLSDSQSS